MEEDLGRHANLLFKTRSASIRESRAARMSYWFKGRQWRICTELSGPVDGGTCTEGEVRLTAPSVFQTPFGHRGRHGYIIQEVARSDGRDLSTRPVTFGLKVLREAQELYGSIVNLPPPRPRGRPRKSGG